MRFNSPPGWPVSPGWAPDPGFVPDSSWPPAPPGWQFWIDDSAPVTAQTLPHHGLPSDPVVPPPHGVPPYPGAELPYPGPPQWQPGGPFGPPPVHTTRNVLIVLGVGVVLVALIAGLVFAFGGDSTKPKSEEDQIRTIVAGLESSWNNTDYDAFMKHTCHEFATDSSHSESSFKRDRSKNGEATLKVTSIKVNGENADVTVDRTYADQSKARSVELDFVKEDGEWKMCPR